ncbi:MAG TPA: CarD family transcriptional regulator [Hyphomicrobium sp.]|nr:CarD family transcriptional regulator [Hyphomicrobium sp.]
MAQKKKAPATRSAKSATLAGKKAGSKVTAAKKPGRVDAKAVAKKPVAKGSLPTKGKKPVAKTAGTAAPVKKPVKPAAKVAPKTVAAKPAAPAPARAAAPAPAKAATAVSAKTAPAPARAVAAAVKPSGQKITAPVPPQQHQQQMTPKAVAEKAAAARQAMTAQNAQKKPVNQRHGFKASEFVVYPAHGVGKIIAIEEQEIAGMALELFVINFEKEKLTLRVPTGKLESVGMRKLSEEPVVKKAMEILKGRARVKRTMWSRRAQEYVAKINSGDLVSIAEVVRDLYRSEAQPEQSYSERQLYEDALDRMAREIAAVEKLDERGAVQRITDVLSKSARGRRLAAEAEENGEAVETDAETRAA